MRGGVPQYIFRRQVLVDRGGFVSFPKAWASDDATAVMMAEHGVVTSQEHLVRFRWSDINISSDSNLIAEKIIARLQHYEWLKTNLKPINVIDEKSNFLHKNIDLYLHVFNKTVLISHLKRIPFMRKIECFRIIYLNKQMSIKDKISVFKHSI